eukprot:sb/3473459/
MLPGLQEVGSLFLSLSLSFSLSISLYRSHSPLTLQLLPNNRPQSPTMDMVKLHGKFPGMCARTVGPRFSDPPDLVTPRFSDWINFPRYRKLTVFDPDLANPMPKTLSPEDVTKSGSDCTSFSISQNQTWSLPGPSSHMGRDLIVIMFSPR